MKTEVIDTEIIEQSEVKELPVQYNITDAAINQLRLKYSGLVITDKQSYKNVVLAISDVRTCRTSVEKYRKEKKSVALDYGRRIDAEAKRITGLLEEIEEPLKAKRQAEDSKETVRIAAIQARIDAIFLMVPTTPTSSDVLSEILFDIDTMEIGEDFQEFREQAEQVRSETSAKLEEIIFSRKQWEAEEKKRREELAELETLKIENVRIEAELRAREEAEEKIRKAEREAIEVERRTLEVERAKLEVEQRMERERKEQEEYLRQETIRSHARDRTMMLSAVGCECIPGNLGTISREEFLAVYDEYKKAWDFRQEQIRLEQEEKTHQEKIEFEYIVTAEAERKAKEKQEREESERKMKAEVEEAERVRQEALRPDKEKLLAFASYLENELAFPNIVNEKAQQVRFRIMDMISQVIIFIRSEVQYP